MITHPYFDQPADRTWVLTLGTVKYSGKVTVGLSRTPKTDHHRPANRQGGRSVQRSKGLARINVELTAINPTQTSELEKIYRSLFESQGDAVPIAWPTLALARVTQVTGKSFDWPALGDDGLLVLRLELEEHRPVERRTSTHTAAPATQDYPGTAFDDAPTPPAAPAAPSTNTTP